MLRFALILLQLLPLTSLHAQTYIQERDWFCHQFGLDSLTSDGKDTFYFHCTTELSNTIQQIREDRWCSISMMEERDIYIDYFRDKLDSTDLLYIYRLYGRIFEDSKAHTLKNAPKYRIALQCQKTEIRRLEDRFYSKLMQYRDTVNAVLTNDEKRQIQSIMSRNLERLENIKQGFLRCAESGRSFDPAKYDYLQYGFDLMAEIPASYYYDLLDRLEDNKAMTFVESLPLEEYYVQYEEFNMALIESLKGDCRAHVAIPFYHSQGPEREVIEKRHRKRNAIYFMAPYFE